MCYNIKEEVVHMKVTLETNRLLLRPFVETDAIDMYNNWASDDEVTKYLTWNTHQNIEVSKSIIDLWIRQYDKPERINFAITLKETNELIGGIDVVGYLDKIPVIGYVLGKKYWNNGYMSEACENVLKYLFSLGHEKVIIDAVVENIGSNRVIKKCGGIFEKEYSEFCEQKNKFFNINRYYVYK
jgi:ribosomal-protein-alanine N-acetyltransferase